MGKSIYVESYSGDVSGLFDHGFHEAKRQHSVHELSAEEARAHIEFNRFTHFSTRENMLLMQEGLPEALDSASLDPENRRLREVARLLFPKNTLPSNFHELSDGQRKFLSEYGAAKTLLYLDKINVLYPLAAGGQAAHYQQINELAQKQSAEKVFVAVFHDSHADDTAASPALMGDIRSMVYIDAGSTVIGYQATMSSGFRSVSHTHGSLRGSAPELPGLAEAASGIVAIGAFVLLALVGKCCRRKRYVPKDHNSARPHEN